MDDRADSVRHKIKVLNGRIRDLKKLLLLLTIFMILPVVCLLHYMFRWTPEALQVDSNLAIFMIGLTLWVLSFVGHIFIKNEKMSRDRSSLKWHKHQLEMMALAWAHSAQARVDLEQWRKKSAGEQSVLHRRFHGL